MKKIFVLILTIIILCIACGEENKYVGSVYSDIYHYPSCEWAEKINPSNEIWFSSPSEAQNQGYRSCKVCYPPN